MSAMSHELGSARVVEEVEAIDNRISELLTLKRNTEAELNRLYARRSEVTCPFSVGWVVASDKGRPAEHLAKGAGLGWKGVIRAISPTASGGWRLHCQRINTGGLGCSFVITDMDHPVRFHGVEVPGE